MLSCMEPWEAARAAYDRYREPEAWAGVAPYAREYLRDGCEVVYESLVPCPDPPFMVVTGVCAACGMQWTGRMCERHYELFSASTGNQCARCGEMEASLTEPVRVR